MLPYRAGISLNDTNPLFWRKRYLKNQRSRAAGKLLKTVLMIGAACDKY